MCGCAGNVNRLVKTSHEIAAEMAAAEAQRLALAEQDRAANERSLAAAVGNASS